MHFSDKSDLNLVQFETEYTKAGCTDVPKCTAEQLMNDVFAELHKEELHAKISSSSCNIRRDKRIRVDQMNKEDDDMDPRLKCWQKVLKERKQLQDRIARRTGKRAEDVLFNRHATIDEPTKKMLIRLMDTAERSEGIPPTRVRGVLKMRQNLETCHEIRELRATDPKLAKLEFVGLPKVTQMELAATQHPGESQWQRSEILGARLEQQESKIMRVLSHCPDMEQLQVCTLAKPYDVPVINSKRVGEEMMFLVSPETSEDATAKDHHKQKHQQEHEPEEEKELYHKIPGSSIWAVNNMISINGRNYGFGDVSALSNDVEMRFQCDPMQHVRQTIVELENTGSKFIQIRWQRASPFKRELQQNIHYSNEFLFDTLPFVLLPGQRRRIDVLYQPNTVGIRKQRWCMHLLRSPFCGIRRYTVRFLGICTTPATYGQRLDRDLRLVVDKRKRQVTERLAKMHAELAPIVERSLLICPYQRTLDERELFNAQNPGFKCQRYAELETLKELYALVKKPRQPLWDYSLDSLRQCIYQHEVKQRESLQNILVDVLGPMRCSSDELVSQEQGNQQRERSCFLYVRGIICTTIEDWEKLSECLGQQFFKSELQVYLNDLRAKEQAVPRDAKYVEWLVSRKVLASKYFKDALYIQTYTIVCDAAENIVSAIESTMNS